MFTVQALKNEVSKNKICPVYLLMGEEREDKKELIEQIIENLSKKSGNVEKYTFFGDEAEISDILNELQTYSFFDDTKVIIVKNVEKLNINGAFFSYLSNPNDKAVLFLLTDKNDISKTVQNAVGKIGRVVKFWKSFQNSIERWLVSELKKREIPTDKKSIKYIIEITGNQKEDILNQINTISNYLESGEILNVEKLKKIISRITRYTVFDLINSIFIKDPIELVKIFRGLIDNGEDIVKINYFIWKYLKTLIAASSYRLMGYTDNKIISTLKLRKLESSRVIKIISGVSIDLLNRVMSQLERIDYFSKTRPKIVSILQLEELLLGLKRFRKEKEGGRDAGHSYNGRSSNRFSFD